MPTPASDITMWLQGEAWSNEDLSQMLLKTELGTLDEISRKISPREGCSGVGAGGMPIPGTVQDVALGDRAWTEPMVGFGFRALLQQFLSCTPKKTWSRWKSRSGCWGSSWNRWVRPENEEKGALSWLFVIPGIFAASRFRGGFEPLEFQICFQPKFGKSPTRMSLNQFYFCWFLKYGTQQIQETSLCTTDTTKINFLVISDLNSSCHGLPNS